MISTSIVDSTTDVPSSAAESVRVTADSKGRVRLSKEQRRLILAEYERSGVPAARFAKGMGLKYSTFAGWLQRYRRAKPKGRPQTVRLLEAVVEQAQDSLGKDPLSLVLELPGGGRVEIGDVRQIPLATVLLKSLSQP